MHIGLRNKFSISAITKLLSEICSFGFGLGLPGRDYPTYDKVPPSFFTCQGRVDGGYYGDPETRCQAFHVCTDTGSTTGLTQVKPKQLYNIFFSIINAIVFWMFRSFIYILVYIHDT